MTDAPDLPAGRCPNGHLWHPGTGACPDCGEAAASTVDLSDREGTVTTWTTSRATPTGVREPNTLAFVDFEVDGEVVSVLGQVTTDDVAIGTRVRPVYVDRLRDPEAAVRDADSQRWDGYRFDPVD